MNYDRLKDTVVALRESLNINFMVKIFTHIIFPRFWRDWWYWNKVEDRLLAYVKKTATQGDPASVLAAVEKYNEEHEWTIMLEPDKRVKAEEVVRKTTPKVCFEMGCYIGCSAIAVGRHLPAGGRLITAELDPTTADIARQLILFAGLDQVITVVTAKADEVAKVLRSQYSVDKLDLVFIDHEPKSHYVEDLKLLEELDLMRKGTVVMADNILYPGTPGYLEYVEGSGRYQTERFHSLILNVDIPDIMTISFYSGNDTKTK